MLLKKAKAAGEDPLLAFLDWRNTPTECLESSPAQRLMGRRTRTLLPTHKELLKQDIVTDTKDKLAYRKSRQSRQYNKKHCPLQPLKHGHAIRMRLPNETKWTLGTCTNVLGNRSYEVEVSGRRYRRNRRHLRATQEKPPPKATPFMPNESEIEPHKQNQNKPGDPHNPTESNLEHHSQLELPVPGAESTEIRPRSPNAHEEHRCGIRIIPCTLFRVLDNRNIDYCV